MLDTANWEIVKCEPFLDASRTPTIPRMLWLPIQFEGMQRMYGQHCLFRRADKSPLGKTAQEIAEDTHIGENGESDDREERGEAVPIEVVDHIGKEI